MRRLVLALALMSCRTGVDPAVHRAELEQARKAAADRIKSIDDDRRRAERERERERETEARDRASLETRLRRLEGEAVAFARGAELSRLGRASEISAESRRGLAEAARIIGVTTEGDRLRVELTDAFEKDAATLSDAARTRIDGIAGAVAGRVGLSVEIVVGAETPDEAGFALAERRAHAALVAMLGRGLAGARVGLVVEPRGHLRVDVTGRAP